MNIKEFKDSLGDSPKINNAIVALLHLTIQNQAILDAILASQTELLAVIRNTTLDQEKTEMTAKIERTDAELRALIASFII